MREKRPWIPSYILTTDEIIQLRRPGFTPKETK